MLFASSRMALNTTYTVYTAAPWPTAQASLAFIPVASTAMEQPQQNLPPQRSLPNWAIPPCLFGLEEARRVLLVDNP
jgi:hypothetical protein